MNSILFLFKKKNNIKNYLTIIDEYLSDYVIKKTSDNENFVDIIIESKPSIIFLEFSDDIDYIINTIKADKKLKNIPIALIINETQTEICDNITVEGIIRENDTKAEWQTLINTLISINRKVSYDDLPKTETNMLLERITNEISDVIWTSDLNLNINYVSPSIEKIMGFTVDNYLKRNIYEKYPPEEIEKFKRIIHEELIKDNKPGVDKNRNKIIETSEYHSDGSLHHFEVNVKFLRNDSNKPVGFIGVSRDITNLIKIQEQLSENQRILSTIISMLPGTVYRCKYDRSWTMEYISDGCINLTGYKPEDFINNKNIAFNDIIHPKFQDYLYDKWTKILKDKGIFQDEYIIITKSGEKKWIWEQGCGIYSEEGEVISLEGFITDITNNKTHEITQDIILFIAQADNKSFKYIYDFTIKKLSDIINTNNFEIHIFKNNKNTRKNISKNKFDKNIIIKDALIELMCKRKKSILLKENEIINLADKLGIAPESLQKCQICVPIFKDKKVSGFLTFYSYNKEDICDNKKESFELIANEISSFLEKKKIIKELTEAKNRAEEADRLKTAFLQNLSHEIRTPLNAICGFSRILSERDVSKENKKKFASIINYSTDRLLDIVNNIITMSSLATKQEKTNIEKVCINEIINDLFDTYKLQADNKGIMFTKKTVLSNHESTIYTDKTKFYQVLNNLLSNAYKFTHEGIISFGYTKKEKFIEFFVKDTGIGLKPEAYEIIFKSFTQADSTISKKFGGTGLGLSISKGFVELLGGEIWVNSVLGKGSTFYFTIPYKPAK
ncbi:MAG: hypothetical protein Kow0068_21690 [Marinilabiliales bacterium]